MAFFPDGAISPTNELNLGCAVISPSVKTIQPAIKTQAWEEQARMAMPAVPRPMPVIMVGRALKRLTILDTNSCRRMITPAFRTVTCSTSNSQADGFCVIQLMRPFTALFTGVMSMYSFTYKRTVPYTWKYMNQKPK